MNEEENKAREIKTLEQLSIELITLHGGVKGASLYEDITHLGYNTKELLDFYNRNRPKYVGDSHE